MSSPAEAVLYYRDQHQGLERDPAGAAPEWLRRHRRDAALVLEQRGFPSQRQEDWRYTNVTPILDQRFAPARAADLDGDRETLRSLLPADGPAHQLVLVNGHFDPVLSRTEGLPAGVEADGLARFLERDPEALRPWLEGNAEDGFAALNSALAPDGVVLRVADGVALDPTIEIVHLSGSLGRDLAAQPRTLVLLGIGARLRLGERYLGPADARYLQNGHTRIGLGAGARLEHQRIQEDGVRAFHLGRIQARLADGSSYQHQSLALGGRIGRTEIRVDLDGPGAECRLDALFVAGDGQVLDFHTKLEHAAPGCISRERVKGILAGRGRGVFDGGIHVYPGADGTDARMSSDHLLLSRDAEVDTKPQLEIYAEDVKCSHGATVGQLDPTALYYLRSRGIPEGEARRMLTRAFALDLLDGGADAEARERAVKALERRLEALHV